jgi:hypothetical protein
MKYVQIKLDEWKATSQILELDLESNFNFCKSEKRLAKDFLSWDTW